MIRTQQAKQVITTYQYTTGADSLTVPVGCEKITVYGNAAGASGGWSSSTTASGGEAGQGVDGFELINGIDFDYGDTLSIILGAAGAARNTEGTPNSGGNLTITNTTTGREILNLLGGNGSNGNVFINSAEDLQGLFKIGAGDTSFTDRNTVRFLAGNDAGAGNGGGASWFGKGGDGAIDATAEDGEKGSGGGGCRSASSANYSGNGGNPFLKLVLKRY